MSKIKENWKKIEGFNDIYEVSDWGNVRTIEHLANSKSGNKVHLYPSKMKAQRKVPSGYLTVGLMDGNKAKPVRVHVLVATAFVKNDDPINKTQVNHKDENKENNCAWNLEWCTPRYNCNYGDRNNKLSEKNSKPIEAYDKDENLIYKFKSMKEAEKLGFSNSHISSCCRGNRKTHKGLKWKYGCKGSINGTCK